MLTGRSWQIWFQNRRQVTRRQAAPLLPLNVYSSSQSSHGSGDENPSSSFASSCEIGFPSSHSEISTVQSFLGEGNETDNCTSSANERAEKHDVPTMSQNSKQGNSESQPQDISPPIDGSSHVAASLQKRDGTELEKSEGDIIPPSMIAEGAGISEENAIEAAATCIEEKISAAANTVPEQRSEQLKRTSSAARLCTSLDGKAEIVLGTGNTPSPPAKTVGSVGYSQLPAPLRRSKSAANWHSQSPAEISEDLKSWPRRSTLGRSRDPRTWEFYCDSDARNALNVQAEQEQKGSALGLLGLIRSGPGKSKAPLSTLNKPISHTTSVSVKRKAPADLSSERPKISRTTSSLARLQNVDVNKRKFDTKSLKEGSKPRVRRTNLMDASGDSDKENWEPGTQSRNVRRQGNRPVVENDPGTTSRSMSLENLLNQENETPRQRRRKGMNKSEDKGKPTVDAETAKFVGDATLPRQGDDLDCVHHLLSLSQGAWK
jgi:hypothetical protein